MDEKLRRNQQTWDAVASNFFEASALPVWGPFGVGEDLDLIPEIEDKIFLEICCGSGRSIRYLMNEGAKKVYGIDFSETQLEEARRYIENYLQNGSVELIKSPMEERLDLKDIDVAFSVYGLGWTHDPEKTLANIHSYLKPGGLFIWSWDHTIFSDVKYKNGDYVVSHSYHDDSPILIKDWHEKGCDVYITYRKTSTWFQYLIDSGFSVIGYYEPIPINLSRGNTDPSKYYSIQKAQKLPTTMIFKCIKI